MWGLFKQVKLCCMQQANGFFYSTNCLALIKTYSWVVFVVYNTKNYIFLMMKVECNFCITEAAWTTKDACHTVVPCKVALTEPP